MAGGALRIAAIQALGMGGVEAVSAAAPLLAEYHIRCLAMCGVCAGRRGKVQLGDVIIADRMWTYDTGKQEEAQVKQDIDMYRIHPPEWKQRAERFVVGDAPWLAQRPWSYEAQGDWLLARVHAGGNPSSEPERGTKCADFEIVVKKLWERGWLKQDTLTLTEKGRKRIEQKLLLHHGSLPEPKSLAVHCAPIASGSKVVEDPAIFDRLSTPVRKVLGVEMEASAIATLAYHQQLEGAVVMKAVMDHADRDKSDNFKTFAARASAECLLAFLRENLSPRIGSGPAFWGKHSKPVALTGLFLAAVFSRIVILEMPIYSPLAVVSGLFFTGLLLFLAVRFLARILVATLWGEGKYEIFGAINLLRWGFFLIVFGFLLIMFGMPLNDSLQFEPNVIPDPLLSREIRPPKDPADLCGSETFRNTCINRVTPSRMIRAGYANKIGGEFDLHLIIP